MHEMPDEWQDKMATLLNEYEETFPNQPPVSTHVSIKEGGKFTVMFNWLCNYRYPSKHKIAQMREQPKI